MIAGSESEPTVKSGLTVIKAETAAAIRTAGFTGFLYGYEYARVRCPEGTVSSGTEQREVITGNHGDISGVSAIVRAVIVITLVRIFSGIHIG